MNHTVQESYSLEIFEGPLPFLLHLIQKSEIDICDVPIQKLTAQFLDKMKDMLAHTVDTGAEFIGTTAFLLWMKSKMLLPKHEELGEDPEDLDPGFEIIHKLLEYCYFKEAAKILTAREHEQSDFQTRGVPFIPEAPKKLGIEHLTLEDLEALFLNVLERTSRQNGKIREEYWRVSDKIQAIRHLLGRDRKVGLDNFFSKEMPKGELIVTFLAILELMKIGEALVGKEIHSDKIFIIAAGADG